MKNLRYYSDNKDEIKDLNQVFELAPNDPRLELLFMRLVSALEEDVWVSQVGLDEANLLDVSESRGKIQDLLDFAAQVSNHPRIENKDLWLLSDSYLSFLASDFDRAHKKLIEVRSERFKDQKQILETVYRVFTWKQIGATQEEFLTSVLGEVIGVKSVDLTWG